MLKAINVILYDEMRARAVQQIPEKNGVLEEYKGKGWGFQKVKSG